MEHWERIEVTPTDGSEMYVRWRLKVDPRVEVYIQPGGCLEIYQMNQQNEQDWPHLCPDVINAMKEMMDHWELVNAR